MKVSIITRQASPMGLEALYEDRGTKVIDWLDSSDRKWLKNHLHWAMLHNRQVILTPVA